MRSITAERMKDTLFGFLSPLLAVGCFAVYVAAALISKPRNGGADMRKISDPQTPA